MNAPCNSCFNVKAGSAVLWCGHYMCKMCYSKKICFDKDPFHITCFCLFETGIDLKIKQKNYQHMDQANATEMATSNTYFQVVQSSHDSNQQDDQLPNESAMHIGSCHQTKPCKYCREDVCRKSTVALIMKDNGVTRYHPECAAVDKKVRIMNYSKNVISSKRIILKRKFDEINIMVQLIPLVEELEWEEIADDEQ